MGTRTEEEVATVVAVSWSAFGEGTIANSGRHVWHQNNKSNDSHLKHESGGGAVQAAVPSMRTSKERVSAPNSGPREHINNIPTLEVKWIRHAQLHFQQHTVGVLRASMEHVVSFEPVLKADMSSSSPFPILPSPRPPPGTRPCIDTSGARGERFFGRVVLPPLPTTPSKTNWSQGSHEELNFG
ncbi:unnamed protein product [Mesocestoides corti]|uniref:Uncharacterized protein n=1 Tax=Mesocestoides corti TaxID=53468 RepID=A0A0R3UL70_MESCO|nr:unnamed protein product [Mesocestoides corti]